MITAINYGSCYFLYPKWKGGIIMATFPCRNCVYFDACGERNRTVPCDRRETKSDLKRKRKTESAEKRKASK